MQVVPLKINPGFPWQKRRSSRRKFKEESNELLYFWSTVLYGTGALTLRKVDQKYIEGFKYGAGEG